MSITEQQLHEAIELGDEFLVGAVRSWKKKPRAYKPGVTALERQLQHCAEAYDELHADFVDATGRHAPRYDDPHVIDVVGAAAAGSFCKTVEDELRGEIGASPRVVFIRYPNGGYRAVSATEAAKYNTLSLAAKKLYQARHDPTCANVSGVRSPAAGVVKRYRAELAAASLLKNPTGPILARATSDLVRLQQSGVLSPAETKSAFDSIAQHARFTHGRTVGAKPPSYYRMVQTPGGVTLRMAAHLADQWKALSPAQQRSLLWRATRNRTTKSPRQLPCL